MYLLSRNIFEGIDLPTRQFRKAIVKDGSTGASIHHLYGRLIYSIFYGVTDEMEVDTARYYVCDGFIYGGTK